MIPFLLILFGVWLSVLTIVVFGLARQQAMLQLASVGGPPKIDLNADGPTIGAEVPGEVLRLLNESAPAWARAGKGTIIFMSATCGPCRDIANEIAGEPTCASEATFLIAGSRDLANDLVDVLRPTGRPIVLNPEAQDIVREMNVHSSPFGFAVSDGRVVAKRFIRRLDDVSSFAPSSAQLEGSVR